MFLKNLQIIARRFQKDLAYTMFNIIGLAVGFSVMIYISLYIHHELTYDKFIPSHESIFRVSDKSYALTSTAHLGYLTENMDEIQHETYLLNSGNFLIGVNDQRQIENSAYYVTEDFFKVFDYPVASGSYERFENISNALVITQSMEQKLFGSKSGLGEEVMIYQGDEQNIYQIIAVIEDLPTNTHLSFNMLVRMPAAILDDNRDNWGYTIYHGYVKTENATTTDGFQNKVNRVYAQRVLDKGWIEGAETIEDVMKTDRYGAQKAIRVDDIYFNSNLNFDLKAGGDYKYLWIFGSTAVLILLLAITNFINLATAQSARKAKEVGVRKTLGSSRSALVGQFLTESILLCLIAALLALGMVEFLIPLMKTYLAFEITFSIISSTVYLAFLLILALIVGVLGGLYPAYYLTAFKSAAVMKGQARSEGTPFLRNALVIFQFTISIGLGVFVYTVQDQLHYSLEKDAGFDKENVVMIDNSLEQLGNNAQSFKNSILSNSSFASAGYFNFDLVSMSSTFIAPESKNLNVEPFRVYYQWTDSSYFSTMKFELVEGIGFSQLSEADSSVIILNETAVKELGFTDPIGQRIEFGGAPGNFEIIGVVKDFHHQSFNKKVPPTAFVYAEWVESTLAVRLNAGKVSESLNTLEKIWKENTPQPFDYQFVDQDFERLFEKEQRLGKITSVFTFLAFFVACLGLLGLAGYLAERKTKEIGIRKALGASIEQIASLFSKQFVKLVVISMLVALPISYYAVQLWLDSYVYKAPINYMGLLIVCVAALAIVLLTVSYHAIKSALANPVKALKEE